MGQGRVIREVKPQGSPTTAHMDYGLSTGCGGLSPFWPVGKGTNASAWNFSVLMSTNLADWDYLGPATPLYQFFDTNAPAQPQRYYRLRWP